MTYLNKENKMWFITYSKTNNTFLITKNKTCYWQASEIFTSEQLAIKYFKDNLNSFRNIRNGLLLGADSDKSWTPLYLENTGELFI